MFEINLNNYINMSKMKNKSEIKIRVKYWEDRSSNRYTNDATDQSILKRLENFKGTMNFRYLIAKNKKIN